MVFVGVVDQILLQLFQLPALFFEILADLEEGFPLVFLEVELHFSLLLFFHSEHLLGLVPEEDLLFLVSAVLLIHDRFLQLVVL